MWIRGNVLVDRIRVDLFDPIEVKKLLRVLYTKLNGDPEGLFRDDVSTNEYCKFPIVALDSILFDNKNSRRIVEIKKYIFQVYLGGGSEAIFRRVVKHKIYKETYVREIVILGEKGKKHNERKQYEDY